MAMNGKKGAGTQSGEFYPHQGSYHASDCEPDGSPGTKEPEPGRMASMASSEGNHDISGQIEFARRHGLPAVKMNPDNVSGDVESAGPTKGEGAASTY